METDLTKLRPYAKFVRPYGCPGYRAELLDDDDNTVWEGYVSDGYQEAYIEAKTELDNRKANLTKP